MALPPYASTGQKVWHWTFRGICVAILFFLIMPILVIIPLSFNAQDFFTFTPGMLRLDPEAYSLKHYQDFFSNPDWQQALRNSITIAPVATGVRCMSLPPSKVCRSLWMAPWAAKTCR